MLEKPFAFNLKHPYFPFSKILKKWEKKRKETNEKRKYIVFYDAVAIATMNISKKLK